MRSGSRRLSKAEDPLSLRLSKVRVCWEEPHQLVPLSEDIGPPHRPEILHASPDPALSFPPLHPVNGSQAGDDPMELVHEHAEGENHGRCRDDEHGSDKVGREGAVVVAIRLRHALHEVVQHQSDRIAGDSEGVEEEQDEVLLVGHPDAVVHPRAVMVHPHYASPAQSAVMCTAATFIPFHLVPFRSKTGEKGRA